MNIVRILVPVDFSYHANGAIRLAVYLANRWGAAITVLHVDPLPGVGTVAIEPIYIAPQVFESLHAEHDANVEARLAELRDEFLPLAGEGVTIEVEHRRGDATPGIIEFAEAWQPDVIVMGCAGMARYRARLEAELGIPVVEPTQAATAMALGRVLLADL